MLRRLSCVVVLVASVVGLVPAQTPVSPHAYFESLVARPDHWRSYSLRDPAQLDYPNKGGYAQSNSGPLAVTYAPAVDTDPQKQDAAKVVIPAWRVRPERLVQPLAVGDMAMHLSDANGDVTKVSTGFNAKGNQYRVGNEIIITRTDVVPLDRATGIVLIGQRGAYGTTAQDHPVSAVIQAGGNSLQNQVRVPVDTHDGATWLITWDGYFTASYLNNGIGNFKAFQLSSDKAIWLEPQVHFDGGNPRPAEFDPAQHVGVTGRMRSYNNLGGAESYADNDPTHKARRLGPSVTNNNPVLPTHGGFFVLHPNRWTRWWVRIEQRANDYDLMDAWMADEVTGPVEVYRGIPVSVRATNGVDTINQFYVEFNTSTAQLPAGRTTDFRDLVAYVRNIAVLRNPPASWASLRQRPVGASVNGGGTPPVLSAPHSLRIFKGYP